MWMQLVSLRGYSSCVEMVAWVRSSQVASSQPLLLLLLTQDAAQHDRTLHNLSMQVIGQSDPLCHSCNSPVLLPAACVCHVATRC